MMMPTRFIRKSCLIFCASLLALTIPALAIKTADTETPDPAVVAADPHVQNVAAANTDFGFRLLAQLNKATPDKNIFFSPFSVSNCLTMVLNGAGGQTQSEMATTLGLNAMTLDQINEANGLLLPSLKNSDPSVAISVANALWANTGTKFNPDFQQRCHTSYGAQTDMLNFRSPAAVDTINGWVKDNTQGKIDQLVTSDDIMRAKAVLTNAVYFHGPWSVPFQKWDTQDGLFTLAAHTSKTVPMMLHYGTYPYFETPGFQVVSLPYGAGRMSMDVFLPKPGSDLNDFLRGLSAAPFDEWISRMKPTLMNIYLPRFKAEYETKLNTPLKEMGMDSAFASRADFAPMGLRRTAISEVIHKAIIDVDEKGTVAAAATAVTLQLSLHKPPKTEMRVDHPFFIAIRDNTTGTLLFAGVIRDPK